MVGKQNPASSAGKRAIAACAILNIVPIMRNALVGLIVETLRHDDMGSIIPPGSKSMIRQCFPGEPPVWIYFPSWSNIAVTNKIFLWYFVSVLQAVEQNQEAVDLRVSKIFKPVVV